MADLVMNTGETKSLKVAFLDGGGAVITPPQQMTFVSSDPDLVVGNPTALDTVPLTAGSTAKQGVGIAVTAPGITNGNATVTIDVASNQQSGPVGGGGPVAASVQATLS